MRIKKVIKKITPSLILNAWLSYKLRKGWFERQSTELDNHLEVYWNSRNAPNRIKLIEVLKGKILNCSPTKSLAILEYGSHVGINLDMLSNVDNDTKIIFYAVEPNLDAVNFLTNKLPFISCLNSDDVGFVNDHSFPAQKIDISFVNSVFYCMSSARVRAVLGKLARISDVIVLGEGMSNAGGSKSYFISEPPCYQHPYNIFLLELGFFLEASIDAPDPREQLNKFNVYKKLILKEK